MEFKKLLNRGKRLKTGAQMNFNVAKLESGMKCFVLSFLRALRVLRGEAVLPLWEGVSV